MTKSAALILAEVARAQARLQALQQPATPLEDVQLPGIAQPVHIKREDLSVVRSYKWRGAFNRMMQLDDAEKARPVITASAGNHAQGVAWAARVLDLQAHVYMPLSTPLLKQEAVRLHGGSHVQVELVGDTYNQAASAAYDRAEMTGAVYIPAFDNLHTIAGQATIGREIVDSGKGPFDVAFLQIGGGGMAAGVSAVLRAAYPDIWIVGVEGEGQASMKASFDAGYPLTLDQVDGFCDGTAVTRPGDLCFDICRETLDEIITVNNGSIHAAMETMWNATRSIPEPSGAMGLAGLMQWTARNSSHRSAANRGDRMLTVISGANMDFNKLRSVFGAEAAGPQGRSHLRLKIDERNGSLLNLIETCFRDVNILGFQYGKVDHASAWPVIAFEADAQSMSKIRACLFRAGIEYEDITGAADAANRIIPYNPRLFENPLMLHVEFPERKGALREFMRVVQPHANTCYFNYQYTGDLQGYALMGFEFASMKGHAPFMEAIRNTPVTVRPVEDLVRQRMLYTNPTP